MSNSSANTCLALGYLSKAMNFQAMLQKGELSQAECNAAIDKLADDLAEKIISWTHVDYATPNDKRYYLVDALGRYGRARFFNGEWQSGIGEKLNFTPVHWCYVKPPTIPTEVVVLSE